MIIELYNFSEKMFSQISLSLKWNDKMMVVEPLHHHISKKPFCSITIIFFKKSNIIQRAMVENFPLRHQQNHHHHQAILLTHCKMKMK